MSTGLQVLLSRHLCLLFLCLYRSFYDGRRVIDDVKRKSRFLNPMKHGAETGVPSGKDLNGKLPRHLRLDRTSPPVLRGIRGSCRGPDSGRV